MKNDPRIILALTMLIASVLFVMLVPFLNPTAEYYSLIVTDAYGYQWAVDYNLTLPDCLSMKASPAAECSIQPQGEI